MGTAVDPADGDGGGGGGGEGLLSLLRDLVRATATRISGLVRGYTAPATAASEDADVYEVAATPPRRVRYHGYQLLRVKVRDQEEGEQLRRLLEQEERVQLWRHAVRNHTADVLLPPDTAPAVKDSLEYWGLDYTVLSADVQVSTKLTTTRNLVTAMSQGRHESVTTPEVKLKVS